MFDTGRSFAYLIIFVIVYTIATTMIGGEDIIVSQINYGFIIGLLFMILVKLDNIERK
jgi:hypothetical protein